MLTAISLSVGIIVFIVIYLINKLFYFSLVENTIKICEAKEDYVTLRGVIKTFAYILSPLSKQPCCGYLYLVIDKHDSDQIVHIESNIVDFLLDDKTGKCIVHPQSVGTFHNNAQWPPYIRFGDSISPFNLNSNPGNKRYRHMEYRRQEGEEIFLQGYYQRANAIPNDFPVLIGTICGKEDRPLEIIPAYKGSEVSTSNEGSWFIQLIDPFLTFCVKFILSK
ncbi:hypothetical protein [Legionella sp. PC997]|uniref:hypothetical protein n=1 Tax=Legionella sp. PC997 TaxID=2755562 RepID=UPI0015FE0000|nr:hypothetical protein [Legionella sp. PC997]QMT61165.1 hypothetical protein HBNCFIEN_02560 [Legionella sp. PC997]